MEEFKPLYHPLFVLLLDGWGLSTSWRHTALPDKAIPNLTHLWHNYPHAALRSLEILRGRYGHVTDINCAYESLGTGTVVLQPAAAIAAAIHDKSFYDNPALGAVVGACAQNKGALHLVGHISFSQNYSYLEHLYAIIRAAIAHQVKAIKCHLILDESALDTASQWLPSLLRLFDDLEGSGVATVAGVDQPVGVLARAIAGQAQATTDSVITFLNDCTTMGLKGDKIPPTAVLDEAGRRDSEAEDNYLFFFDLKNPQIAALSRALCERPYAKRFMDDKKVLGGSLVNYGVRAQIRAAFTEQPSPNSLLEILSQYHFKTALGIFSSFEESYLRFFTGQNEPRWPGVDVASVNAGGDLDSWRRAITHLVNEVGKKSKTFDVLVASLPILSLASETHDAILLQEAAHHLDKEVARVAKYALDIGAGLMVAAPAPARDMQDGRYPNIPVPFILVAPDRTKNLVTTATDYFAQSGFLADMVLSRNSIADVMPTILDLLKIPKPPTVTGQSLLLHLK